MANDPVLTKGMKNDDVALAQRLLNRDGALLTADGDFGNGTLRAVREFRLAHQLLADDRIDPLMWAILRALPEPSPDIPGEAVTFIANEEVGGRAYYDTQCSRPAWPGGASGVTIGVGYDLGYQDSVVADWQDLLPPADIDALRPWIGRRGEDARPGPAQLTQITIPWRAAWNGFIHRTLPQEVARTRGVFVPPAAKPLKPLCLGVLVSLVYNRGTGMTDDPGRDNRKEMRAIRDAVATGDHAAVPAALRAMQRLWPPGNGLRDRREREARLFEAGLSA